MKRTKDNLKQAGKFSELQRKTLEATDKLTKKWPDLSAKQQDEDLTYIKLRLPFCKPTQQNSIKQKLAKQEIVPVKDFPKFLQEGYEAVGKNKPELEARFERTDQAELNLALNKCIPDKGFLKDYIDITTRITDAPKVFLLWGALTTIAAILEKTVWIPWEVRKLYSNIWCIFSGPSGVRKGTGIDIPTTLLTRINPDLLLPQIGSEEGLTKALDKNTGCTSTGFCRWQEFSKVLKSWNTKGSWQASQEFFIDLWDNKSLRKKLSNADYYIEEPCISFLSATTPKSFAKYFTPEDLDGGFFGRIYLITALEKEKYYVIPPAIKEEGELNELAKQLHNLSANENYKGRLDYNEIKTDFEKWAKAEQKKEREQPTLPDSFRARMEVHAMKLTILYEAALTQKKVLTLEAFNYAKAALEFLKVSSRPLIAEEIALTEEEKTTLNVAEYIKKHNPVKRSLVMQNLHLNSWKMDNIEKTLIERETIGIKEEKGTRGPGAKLYAIV